MEIKIEKGVPLPDHVQFKQAVKEAIASLEIGDSFTVPASQINRNSINLDSIAEFMECSIASDRDADEPSLLRVWRTA